MTKVEKHLEIINEYLEKLADYEPPVNIEEAFVEIHSAILVNLAKMLIIYIRHKDNESAMPDVDKDKLKLNWTEIMMNLIKLSKLEKKIPACLPIHITGYEAKSNKRIEILEYASSYFTAQLSKYEPQHWIQVAESLEIL